MKPSKVTNAFKSLKDRADASLRALFSRSSAKATPVQAQGFAPDADCVAYYSEKAADIYGTMTANGPNGRIEYTGLLRMGDDYDFADKVQVWAGKRSELTSVAGNRPSATQRHMKP